MGKETDKSGLINNFVRWTIVICAFGIALTLVISWVLWMTLYKSTIDDILKFFNDKTMAQGYGINFDFLILSFIALLTALLAFLFALPLVFYRKKTGFMVFISLFNFILAALIIVSAILFVMTSYNSYNDFYQSYGLNKVLIGLLPWIIVVFFDLFLIFNSLWSLISAANGVNLIPEIKTKDASLTKEEPEKVNASTDQIIVPQQTNTPQAPQKINENPITNSNIVESKSQEEDEMQPQVEQKNITVTSQLGPFTVYKENEHGAYVLLKDHETTSEEASQISQPGDDGTLKYQGILTPKIEDITPVIANPDQPSAELKKEKVQPITNWTKEQIDEVWDKAQIINDVNPKLYRKDYAGAWMFRDAFTNILEEVNVRSYAWTIVNHCPLSQGGDNSIENLDPMNVTNAITKGEDYPKWKTKISASGNENIIKEQTWKARI